MISTCERCDTPIEQPATGRPRKWCSERCRKAGPSSPPRVRAVGDPIAPAVEELLDHLEFTEDDPRTVAAVMLRRLAEGVDADPGYNVGLARELRQVLIFLSAGGDPLGLGEVDEARVAFLRRRIMDSVSP